MCIFYVLFQRVFTLLLLGNFVHRAIVTLKSTDTMSLILYKCMLTSLLNFCENPIKGRYAFGLSEVQSCADFTYVSPPWVKKDLTALTLIEQCIHRHSLVEAYDPFNQACCCPDSAEHILSLQ